MYESLYSLITKDKIIPFKYNDLVIYGNDRDSGPFRTLRLNTHDTHLKLEFFKNLVKDKGIIFDIGANIGILTLIAAKYSKKDSIVYAFEPDTYNYSLLEKNIGENAVKNTFIYRKAVSNQEGSAKFYTDKFNLGSHSIENKNVSNTNDYYEIECIKLDDFYVNQKISGPVDLIKMDIQGAEYLALLGASELLTKGMIKNIYTEFWPKGIIGTNSHVEFIDYLRKNNFEIKIVDNDGSLEKLDIKSIDESKQYDLLCTLKK